LTGFWANQYTPDLSRALGRQPPFTPYGAERWRTVDTAKDPTGFCLPPGPTRAFTAPFPFLLVQHPDVVAILYESRRSGASSTSMAAVIRKNNRDVEHLQPNQPNLDYKPVPEP
jgi:hypothetical protein